MKTRLFHQIVNKELAKQSLSRRTSFNEEPIQHEYFRCLNRNNVITAKVSDHHPIIHDGILFWNIMMQGKLRNGRAGTGYNNAFGIIETDKDYISRLVKVADVIAEIMYLYPSIDAISICEGPIQSSHINALLQALKKYDSLGKFFTNSDVEDIFHKPNVEGFPNWGLLMLADKKYKVNDAAYDFTAHSAIFSKLANRLQIWELTNDREKSKYIALGHFPFGGNEYVTEKQNLSVYANMYCNLVRDMMKHYSDEQFILCADFNFNPYLISEWKDRIIDCIPNNNSILITSGKEDKLDAVTVDGILLSRIEKQKYCGTRSNFGLFTRIEKEDSVARSNIKDHLIQYRHKSSDLQREYDKRFGLVL